MYVCVLCVVYEAVTGHKNVSFLIFELTKCALLLLLFLYNFINICKTINSTHNIPADKMI